MNRIKEWLKIKLAIFYGNHISLDKKLKGSEASICFVGDNKLGGSITVRQGGMIYYFEGKPEIEEYPNAEKENVVRKTLKYGGWEMDMMHPDNKL